MNVLEAGRDMGLGDGSIGGWQGALLVHALISLLALWPARRLLLRAGLPVAWVVWLILPLFGWAIFATLLAFKTWPTLPPKPEKLHPREKLKREKARATTKKEG